MLVRQTQATRLITSLLAAMSDISGDTIATADTHVSDNTERSLLADGKLLQNSLCKTMPNAAKNTPCKTTLRFAKIILCRITLEPSAVTFTAALRDHLQHVTSSIYDYAIIVKAQKTRKRLEDAVDSSQCVAQSSITKRQFTTSTAQGSHVKQITVAMYGCAAATDVELLDTAKGNL